MHTVTTSKQRAAILDFVATARGNGVTRIYACLPKTHELIIGNKVRQIRVVKDVLAVGWDSLDNRVALTTDLRVLQLFAGEK